MKYLNRFKNVESAIAFSGAKSPNIACVEGSDNFNGLCYSYKGDNQDVVFAVQDNVVYDSEGAPTTKSILTVENNGDLLVRGLVIDENNNIIIENDIV